MVERDLDRVSRGRRRGPALMQHTLLLEMTFKACSSEPAPPRSQLVSPESLELAAPTARRC